MSLPSSIGLIPAATATAEPPDEPPAVRSGRHGFTVRPYRSFQVWKSPA